MLQQTNPNNPAFRGINKQIADLEAQRDTEVEEEAEIKNLMTK